MRIAALDIDGTLLPGSLGLRLLELLRARGLASADGIDAIFAAVRRHRASELSFAEMVNVTTRAYGDAIRGLDPAAIERVAEDVWRARRDALYPFVRPMLAELRRRGLRPVIVSSSPLEVVTLLARELEIPDAAGAVYSRERGRFTGACSLMPGRAGGKVVALCRVLGIPSLTGHVDLANSTAIGDSRSDACVLALVGTPVAFEPSLELRELAEARGWLISDRARVLDDLTRALA